MSVKKILTRLAATAILVVAMVIVTLPMAIRHVATDWLQEHGVKDAKLWNVDLNPFFGTFAIDGLTAGDGLKIGHLACNIDWWPLTRGELYIRACELDDAKFSLVEGKDGRWLPAGLTLPAPTEPAGKEAAPSDGLPVLPVLQALNMRNVEFEARGRSLHLKLPLEYLLIRLEALHADGSQQFATGLQIGPGTFSQGNYTITEDGMYALANLDLPYPDADLPQKLKAKLRVTHIAAVSLSDSGRKLAGFGRLDLGKTIWQGGTLDVRKLKLGDIAVQKALTQATDVTADSLTLDNLVASQARGIRLAELGISNLAAKAKGSHAIIGRLSASKLTVTPKADDIALDSLNLAGADIRLLRTKAGKLDLPATPSTQPSSGSPSSKPNSSEATPPAAPKISIGRIDLATGSRLSFRDESSKPPFETGLTIEKFAMTSVRLPAGEATHLDIRLKTGNQGTLSVQGSIVPDAADPTSDLDVHLQGMDMAQLSGYVENHFGQAIRTGQMDVKSNIKIAKHRIDAGNQLTLRELDLDPAGDKPGGDTADIGMPVDMALDMLRDGKGDISLKVPVSGKLDDPNVNLSDAFNQALMTALQAGALQLAAQFLQPYGSLITVAKLAGKVAGEAGKPRLTPVDFAGQSDALSPDMQNYTGKVAELLKAKPLRLEVCGVATRAEAGPDPKAGMPRKLDDEALLKLAAKRSGNVIQRLSKQGISPERLFHCRDRIDDGKKATPRAELIFD